MGQSSIIWVTSSFLDGHLGPSHIFVSGLIRHRASVTTTSHKSFNVMIYLIRCDIMQFEIPAHGHLGPRHFVPPPSDM